MMEVIDHEPSWWFLVQDGDRMFLDVNCSHSAVSYAFLMELNESERAAYASGGRDVLSVLAKDVQDAGPGASRYRNRNVHEDLRAAVYRVAIPWLKERRDSKN